MSTSAIPVLDMTASKPRTPTEVFVALANEASIYRKLLTGPAAEWESVEATLRLISTILQKRDPTIPGDERHVHLMLSLLAVSSPSTIDGVSVYGRLLSVFVVEPAPREEWQVCALLWCEIQQRLLLFAAQTPRAEIVQHGNMRQLCARLGNVTTPIDEREAERLEAQRDGVHSIARVVGTELHSLLVAFVARPVSG